MLHLVKLLISSRLAPPRRARLLSLQVPVLTSEQVFALIQRVLSLKEEQFDPVDVDALINQTGDNYQDPSQVDSYIDFIRDERRLIDKLQNVHVIERQLSALKILTSKELQTLLTPLHKMFKIELDFLLNVEMDLLRPLDHQRWSGALLDWCRLTDFYGTLIGSESRNKKLLRTRSAGISAAGPNSCEDAILECLELVSLPSLSLRSKTNLVQVCDIPRAVWLTLISVWANYM